jgi:hypothetical protein
VTSSVDAGKTHDDMTEILASPCQKSSTGKHQWVEHGQWPSRWGECALCHEAWFSK